MQCPFCKGPVVDENCEKCGSLEGFTSADFQSILRTPAKMITGSHSFSQRFEVPRYEKPRIAAETTSQPAEISLGPSIFSDATNSANEDDDREVFENSCVDISERVVKVTIGPELYHISQEMEPDDLAPLFSDVWTGSQIWRCSIVACNFMSHVVLSQHGSSPRKNDLDGRQSDADSPFAHSSIASFAPSINLDKLSELKCIELGSGCGLLPIHCARLGFACSVATDQTAMVRLAQHNILVSGIVVCALVLVVPLNFLCDSA